MNAGKSQLNTRIVAVMFTAALAWCSSTSAEEIQHAGGKNAIEPFSNGLVLKMTAMQIKQKFGDPGWHNMAIPSCVIDYGKYSADTCYGPYVARLHINSPGLTLASGIGVGSSKEDVMRVFGNSVGIEEKPYTVEFSYKGDRVSHIKVEYAGPSAGAGNQASMSNDSRGLAGLYWCVAPSWSKGTIKLLPNGTYEMNGKPGGRYKGAGKNVHFDGALKDWDHGVALLENGNLIFEWTNSEGWKQYFAYRK